MFLGGVLELLDQDVPCARSHRRNLAVANGAKLIHPGGQPIIHSVNATFATRPFRARINLVSELTMLP
jgi:hypothetical protein